jgi:hypothetical protein
MSEQGSVSGPRLFRRASSGRALAILLAVTVVSGLAMLPAMATMGDTGESLTDFETCGTVERAEEILDAWGDSGRRAMWLQLALDIPFILGFSLFFAGACTAVARRAAVPMPRLARAAGMAAWLGPAAGCADLVQDLCSALILAGAVEQPWPRLSAISIRLVLPLLALAGVVAVVGYLATRGQGPQRAEAE